MKEMQVNRFDGARHDANAREQGYTLVPPASRLSWGRFVVLGIILAIIIVALAPKAHAQNPDAPPATPLPSPYWNLPPVEYVFDGLMAADMLTTIDGQRRGYVENNPLLGRHPGTGMIVSYFVGTALLHAAITDRIPERWLPLWEAVSIGVEATAVGHNLRIGLRFAL